MTPSTRWVVITNFDCEGMVDIVGVRVLIAGIGGTDVEEANMEAMVRNDVIGVVVIAEVGMVGSTSIRGAVGNNTLNSGCSGRFFNASRCH
uniref:Uncharacterized protein n=1 Tax=Romanomermis culicivorax TaxID=13658 RepID=A0A915JV60_ROMCU